MDGTRQLKSYQMQPNYQFLNQGPRMGRVFRMLVITFELQGTTLLVYNYRGRLMFTI